MAKIGKINRLEVVKTVDFGVYLDGGELDNILLPKRYLPEQCEIGDYVEVFIYLDSEDRLIATTEHPMVMVGQCAHLKVVEVNPIGAFLDWGLPKDLLVPFNEQSKRMEVGQSYTVFIYLDPHTNRIAASCKLNKFLSDKSIYFKPNQAVDLLICQRTDLGYMAVINDSHLGLIHNSEVFQQISCGQKLPGYIKAIRADQKIDLCLQRQGQEARDELSQQILSDLKESGGSSELTDKSPPEAIYKKYGVSKGSYKRALGALYKQRLILIGKDKITLT